MMVRSTDQPSGPTLLIRNIPLFIAAMCGIFMMAGHPYYGIYFFIFSAIVQNALFNRD